MPYWAHNFFESPFSPHKPAAYIPADCEQDKQVPERKT
jgi:hypothetical protein